MQTVLLVIHSLLAIGIIGVVLLQRSEGGALGMGGGGGGGLMTGRSAGSMLTRSTWVLAALFMLTSLGLALLAEGRGQSSFMPDQPAAQTAPVPAPVQPAEPKAPISQ